MSWCWDGFVKEGEILFEYMQYHFTYMIDGEKIKHFDIQYTTWSTIDYYIHVREKYRNIIQSDLISWIVEEFKSKRLINNTNWKPFRDSYTVTDMYLGYNKLFLYNGYYFQLTITSDIWEDIEDCFYCSNNENLIHFELALYGWIEDSDVVQPNRPSSVLLDCMIPLSDWNRK